MTKSAGLCHAYGAAYAMAAGPDGREHLTPGMLVHNDAGSHFMEVHNCPTVILPVSTILIVLTVVFVLQHTTLCMYTWESHWGNVSLKEVQVDYPPPYRLGMPVHEHSGFPPVCIKSEQLLPGITYLMPRAETLFHTSGPDLDVCSVTRTKVAKLAVRAAQNPRAKQCLTAGRTS